MKPYRRVGVVESEMPNANHADPIAIATPVSSIIADELGDGPYA